MGEYSEEFWDKINSKEIIIWDFDGTIADLDIDWSGLKDELIQNFPETPETHVKKINNDLPLNVLIQKYAALGELKMAIDIVYKYESNCSYKMITGVKNLLKTLHSKKMAIFSDNLHSTIIEILSKEECVDYFTVIVGKDDVKNFKPDPEGIKYIQSYFKDSPAGHNLGNDLAHTNAEYILIGNSKKDEESALNAGIEFININNLFS